MNAPFSHPWRKGDQELAPTRPAPRTEGWYRSQAELQAGHLYRDRPGVRELHIQDIIRALKKIDGAFIKNARI